MLRLVYLQTPDHLRATFFDEPTLCEDPLPCMMNTIRWRIHTVIKTLLAAITLIVLIFIVYIAVFVISASRCSNKESLQIIQDLCNDYTAHKIDGKMCQAICHSKDIVFKKCANYRQGKIVLIAECDNACEEGKSVTAVLKRKNLDGHPVEPLNLDKYNDKSLTPESKQVVKSLISNLIFSNTNVAIENFNDIFTKLWMMDFPSFVKNAKYPGADTVAIESLWSLINQDEYLFMSVFQDVHFVPKIYGTCGAFYITEFSPPGDVLDPHFLSAKKAKWKERVDIALQILDISSSLDIDFHEPLHFCDVKEENFGIDSTNQVKILDTDSLFFHTSMMKDLSDPTCTKHDDCDFFDCRGWCDLEKKRCVAKRTNNNLQNICEDIFYPSATNFYTGLLYGPPKEIAAELKTVLEECAYPNQNKGEIVRTPTPKEVFWKLLSILRKSRQYV